MGPEDEAEAYMIERLESDEQEAEREEHQLAHPAGCDEPTCFWCYAGITT